MTDLNQKRPCLALIKLIEATGILLGIPLSDGKSRYKAPLPSNYDATISTLTSDFYGCLNTLSGLASSNISNEVASQLFLKMSEPGFDYEGAVNAGGLASRELFNSVFLILMQLQEDRIRPPLEYNNVLVMLNNAMASYIALDTATHVFNHGVCNIAVVNEDVSANENEQYIYKDAIRRCKQLYKLPDHRFNIQRHTVAAGDRVQLLQALIEELQIAIVVLGIEDSNFGEDTNEELKIWAAWNLKIPVVFTKDQSKTRPFSTVHSSRSFLICVKEDEDLEASFRQASKCFRHSDVVTVLQIAASRDPVGDWRDTRFGFGSRSGWVQEDRTTGPITVGWNDAKISKFRESAETLLSKSQVAGKVRIEERNLLTSVSLEICRYAFEEAVDFVVLSKKTSKSLITECCNDLPCSIILVSI